VASLKHTAEYVPTAVLVKLACLLPDGVADRLGAGLGSLAHAILTSRRRIAIDNLTRAMGDTLGQEEIRRVTREVFRGIGRTVIEFARFGRLGIEGTRRIVFDPDGGREVLQKVLDEGKGAVLICPHFGNWELAGAWAASEGFPIDFWVGTQHNQKIDELFNRFRREMGVGIIPLATGLKQIFKGLRSGRFGCVVPDQHAPAESIILDFFGRPASMAKGPALFAVRCVSPVVPFLLRRERYDRHILMPGKPIYPPGSGDTEADIRTITAAYMKFFEDGIRKHPEQWMWTHRRWKVDARSNKTLV